jgi:hypothetical protein
MYENSNLATDREIARSDEKPREFAENIRRLQKTLVIRGENSRDFVKFAEKLFPELAPRNKIEFLFSEKFISAAWKLNRMQKIEKNILSAQNKPPFEDIETDRMRGIKRIRRVRGLRGVNFGNEQLRQAIYYQNALEKSMEKALVRLREEQKMAILQNRSGASGAGVLPQNDIY